jgi:hypothetical protein
LGNGNLPVKKAGYYRNKFTHENILAPTQNWECIKKLVPWPPVFGKHIVALRGVLFVSSTRGYYIFR